MEVRIGIKQSPRELAFETETPASEISSLVAQAAADATFVTFSDVKGRQYLVDSASIAYLEFGGESGRRVGFVS